MTDNYRSAPEILAAANSLISKNKLRIPKDLRPTRPAGPPVLCCFAETQEAEAKWMAAEMRKLLAQGVPLRDMTVLYRAHYVTRTVEEVLLEEREDALEVVEEPVVPVVVVPVVPVVVVVVVVVVVT